VKAGLLVNFGHILSVGLLVRPWPYRRRRPWNCQFVCFVQFSSVLLLCTRLKCQYGNCWGVVADL